MTTPSNDYNDTMVESTTDMDNWTTVPIRIIMRAPHFHENDSQKHTYLVLKLGDPDYHEHLDPLDNTLWPDEEKVISIVREK